MKNNKTQETQTPSLLLSCKLRRSQLPDKWKSNSMCSDKQKENKRDK